MSHRIRITMLGAITVAAGIAVALLPRVAQPLDYHNFADQRTFLSVPNCLNVISNAPFLLTGVWGLMVVLGLRETPGQPFIIFNLGHIVSGHTLKHLAAALGVYWVFRMLARRRALAPADCQNGA